MSDSEDEFKPKQNNMSKDEQIYGIFTEAYSKPSFGRGQKRSQPYPGQSNKSISFKSGQKIETYSDKIQITLCQTSVKKSNKNNTQLLNNNNINNNQPIQIIQQPQGQQIFTLDSLMNVLSYNQKKNEIQQIQQIQQKVIEKGFTSNTKQILKLRKFQKQIMTQYDYALPTEFGKKPQKIKTIKSNEQIEKQQQFAQRYGIGYKILSKIGFDVTKGLGKNQDGILTPVQSISKQAFIAQDYQEIIGNQQIEQQEIVQELETKDKKILQLFQYFSQDPSINSILSQLKTKYQSLESMISQQIEQIQELKGQFEIQQSHGIQRQSQHKQQQIKRNELVQLQLNTSSHPHLALKFGIDLLIVQDSIKKIKIRKFQGIIDYEFAFNEIKETGRKLEQIYLEKQRENIRQFTSIGLKKSNGLNRLEDTISVSEEDVKKITQLKKEVFQQTVQPHFQKLLNQLIISNDKQCQICIEVLRGLGKIDKTIQQKYLDNHIYPILNRYLITFDTTKKLPHLALFPWFPILSIKKLHFKAFIQHLLSFDWTPESNTMFEIVSPWKKYIEIQTWSKLINFGIVPRLLLFLQKFQIKVTNQNSENINKLRAFIKYSALLTNQQIQLILQDAILPMIKFIYQQLKMNQPQEKTSVWLNSWKSTIKKIITSDNITTFFGELVKQS